MVETVDPQKTQPEPTNLQSGPIPVASAVATALVAGFVLSGWILHRPPLISVSPGLPAMSELVAETFLLCGATLWLLCRSVRVSWMQQLAFVLSYIVMLIGCGTFMMFVAGRETYPDVLQYAGLHPGVVRVSRMSPIIAINFFFLGAAMRLVDVRWRGIAATHVLALVIILDALAAMIGEIFGLAEMYHITPYVEMGLNTAILFLLLSVGVLLCRPERAIRAILLGDDVAGRAARRLMPVALAVPVVMGGVTLIGVRAHNPGALFAAYMLVVLSVALLAAMTWHSIVTLHDQVELAEAFQRQVIELERQRAEHALRIGDERLLHAMEGAGIGTWHWNVPHNELTWSETCKTLLGMLRDADMTRDIFEGAIHPSDREHAVATLSRALEDGASYDIEYRVVWPNETVHWVAARGRGYHDGTGEPLRFEGTLQDIDARRTAQEALRMAAEQQKELLHDVLASVTEGKLRLCYEDEQLPHLLDRDAGSIHLTDSAGLYPLRRCVQSAAVDLGYTDERWQDLVTAASEAGMNAVVHGGGTGTATISTDGKNIVQVRVQDFGTGIKMENLPKATLARGWSTKASFGHGLVMMLQSVDRLWILTRPTGTTVVLEQERLEPLPAWL